jgi:P-type conjugative transfer protein TrbJ
MRTTWNPFPFEAAPAAGNLPGDTAEPGTVGIVAPLPARDPAQLSLGIDADGSGGSEHFAAMDDYTGQAGGRGRRGRGTVWARRTLALAAAVGLAGSLAPERAHAMFGIPGLPQIVFDPTAVAKLVTQIGELRNQLNTARGHAAAFVANTRKLTSPYAWRSINGAVTTVDGVMASGQSLSYSVNALPARLAVTYPGYTFNAATVGADVRARREVTLSTLKGALLAGQASGLQIGQSMSRLAAMKQQIAGATTAQQTAEVSATALVTQAEELTLLRQQLLAGASAEAVRTAEEVNRELQGAAAVRALFTQPARALSLNPPARPSMDPAAYVF